MSDQMPTSYTNILSLILEMYTHLHIFMKVGILINILFPSPCLCLNLLITPYFYTSCKLALLLLVILAISLLSTLVVFADC